MNRLLGEIGWIMTTVLLTIVLTVAIVGWAMDVGALEEREKQRAVFDSLWTVGLPRRVDSILTEAAMIQNYRLQRANDSIIRARRRKCGPLLRDC